MINSYIQKLLQAEREADDIVKKARENWTNKISEGKEAAKQLCEKFKEAELEKLNERLQKDASENNLNDAGEAEAKKKHEEIKRAYKRNKENVYKLISNKVLRVDLNIPKEIAHRLKRNFNKPKVAN